MKDFFLHKNILVTGAGGFIGSHICEELVKQGAFVTAVVRKKSTAKNLQEVKKKITIKEADLTNSKEIKTLFNNASIIIHAAAIDGGASFKKMHAMKIFYENIKMTLNILDVLRTGSLKTFVYISSAEVYINLRNKKNIKEENFSLTLPPTPDKSYAFSKMIGEYAVTLAAEKLGMHAIIVRPANIYGPNDAENKNRLVPTILRAIKNNQTMIQLSGTGQDVRSFLYVSDYVKNLLQLIQFDANGVYNLAGKQKITIENFVSIISKYSGIKITFSEKESPSSKSGIFFLNSRKTKKAISKWHDSDYTARIKELLKTL